ncbi:MAG: cupin [Bacteroidetes bacterium]|nr:cupin [Bacteroidota bacterium]
MPILIPTPTVVAAAGNKPKRIEEFIGRVNSKTSALSVARMKSPAGWVEPGQCPEFDEFTLVLKGRLHIRTKDAELEVQENQAVIVSRKEWVQYSTPVDTEYIAVCLPAFSMETVHRDE